MIVETTQEIIDFYGNMSVKSGKDVKILSKYLNQKWVSLDEYNKLKDKFTIKQVCKKCGGKTYCLGCMKRIWKPYCYGEYQGVGDESCFNCIYNDECQEHKRLFSPEINLLSREGKAKEEAKGVSSRLERKQEDNQPMLNTSLALPNCSINNSQHSCCLKVKRKVKTGFSSLALPKSEWNKGYEEGWLAGRDELIEDSKPIKKVK